MKENKPLVSVLVPAYNHEKFVEQTILSIVHQTYGFENIELIVIDDCSTDSTGKILKKLADKYHFTFIQNEVNKGIVTNANILNQSATGKYVSGCASDDYWHPDKLSYQVELMESLGNEYGVCHTSAYIIDEHNKCLFKQDRGILFQGDIFPKILIDNGIVAPSTLRRRSVYETVGWYDSSIAFEDRDMWIRISQKYKFAYIDKPLVYRRMIERNMSRDFMRNYTVFNQLFEKHYTLYKENNLIEQFQYNIFCSISGYSIKLAVRHLKHCWRYALKKGSIRPFVKLFIPRMFYTSNMFLNIRKAFKHW